MTMMDSVYLLLSLTWISYATGEILLFSCDFGISDDETFCGMEQKSDTNFVWELTSTSMKTHTGPQMDHTGNLPLGSGRFLWADSDNGVPGSAANISTPPFNLTDGEGWLTFWYHLYGFGQLNVIVCGTSAVALDGDQRNEWHQENLTFSCGENPVQIIFMSRVSSGGSDVGIDDIYLHNKVLTSTDATSTSPTRSNEPTATDPNSTGSLPGAHEFTTLAALQTGVPSTPTFTSTSISPLPITGLALPITLGVVAVFFVFALIITICFIMKRRTQPEKPTSQGTVHRFDNHAYSTELDDVRGNTTDTRRNTNSTFDSSTWRSDVSTMGGTGTNGTLGGSQPPNRTSQASSGGSGSCAPGDTGDSDTRHYFVLNPERASMLVEDPSAGDNAQNRCDPVALYDNKPERYTYIENEGSSNTIATVDALEAGTDGYDPVTIKDDVTGGYQVVEDTGSTVVASGMQNPYEPIIVGENPSKSIKTKASERKAPTPAARKNVPPKPKERIMVDNVLYKPMNGEQMVENVLYNPIHDDK